MKGLRKILQRLEFYPHVRTKENTQKLNIFKFNDSKAIIQIKKFPLFFSVAVAAEFFNAVVVEAHARELKNYYCIIFNSY
jgi:hypothetical protein